MSDLREPDLIIEGTIPVWTCNRKDCHATAVVDDIWIHFSAGASHRTMCEEHRFKGGFITANYNGVRSQALPQRVGS